MSAERLEKLILDKLKSNLEGIKVQWNSKVGTSTRHFLLDDLLPNDVALDIYQAFPEDGEQFRKRKSFREKKSTLAELEKTSDILTDITDVFQSDKVIEAISEAIGMSSLQADPTLYAGGLSMMFKDDFLNPHIDNSHDGNRKQYRRLNLLYYVSKDWQLVNGGNFELWDTKVSKPVTIVSKFNRLVVMETNDSSWHSVSPVLVDSRRCCVSNYYFSEASPSGQDYFHVTSFTGRPEETFKKAFSRFDNGLRNCVSKVLKVGRGKKEIRK
ncbi:MAG: Rps23 Pro-64 3,4-dihydroxylase Tpa1-like proline 4-hydroxylase [Nitrospinales bacterium]|jgi:Rps23 Pro-64 3,4-dihydroxylase Tpa1-like proline 4-hydroxylase